MTIARAFLPEDVGPWTRRWEKENMPRERERKDPSGETKELAVLLVEGADENRTNEPDEGIEAYMDDHPLPTPATLRDLRRLYPHEALPPALQSKILREHCPGREADFLEPLMGNGSFLERGFKIFSRLYFITPEEVETIDGLIRRESSPAFAWAALDSLIEALLLQRTKKDFREILAFIVKRLEGWTRGGDFNGAAQVLKKLYACLRLGLFKEWQKRQIKKAIFDAGGEGRVFAIREGLESSAGEKFQGFATYLSLLQRNAIPHLCRLLGELRASKARRIICDALAHMGGESVGVFGAFLDDERWYLVRNMVYILGRIGQEGCVSYLEKALEHPDRRVRREAVRAISKAAPREVTLRHLIGKLEDQDSGVRSLAALELARTAKQEAFPVLLNVATSKGFRKRDVREIRQLLQAIGRAGSSAAIPFLCRVLNKRSLLGNEKSHQIRRGAAEALGVIGTPEALAALREISRMGDRLARRACLETLRRADRRSE